VNQQRLIQIYSLAPRGGGREPGSHSDLWKVCFDLSLKLVHWRRLTSHWTRVSHLRFWLCQCEGQYLKS